MRCVLCSKLSSLSSLAGSRLSRAFLRALPLSAARSGSPSAATRRPSGPRSASVRFAPSDRPRSTRAVLATLSLATATTLSVSACVATTAQTGSEAASFCAVAAPLYPHPNDTIGTLRQAAEHNAKGEALCGWRGREAQKASPIAPVYTPVQQQGQGEPVCGPTVEMFTRLREEYGETPVGRGLTREENVAVIFANPSTGSWTLVLVHGAQDRACLISAGQRWKSFTPPPAGQDA